MLELWDENPTVPSPVSGSVDTTDPTEEARRREGAVQRAIGRLSAMLRTVVVFRYVENLPCDEIAGMLGNPR